MFEDKETAKGLIEVLEPKYGPKFDTHVQLLLDKFNSTSINEGDYIGGRINIVELLAKELVDADNSVSYKIQVITVLNSPQPSWDHIITTLRVFTSKMLLITTNTQNTHYIKYVKCYNFLHSATMSYYL